MSQPLAIYIHWPFCLSKCPYCDFNSHVRQNVDDEMWKKALIQELHHYHTLTKNRTVSSIFFGGGTPSLMSADTIASLINEIHKLWPTNNDLEITLEANPGTFEIDRFKNFKAAGINRLSIGIQSLYDDDLKFLGRKHDAMEAKKALHIAQKLFDNYSFDLIYARPEQTLKNWEKELKEALTLSKNHLSLYQLTIEPNTAFHTKFQRQELTLPDDQLAGDFFDLTHDIMDDFGMPYYEVSNHAKPGFECKHNLTYWRYGCYLGIGPGAHGRILIDNQKRIATRQERLPETWLEEVEKNNHATAQFNEVSMEESAQEYLMMGLRTREGIDLKRFFELTQQNIDEIISSSNQETLIKNNFIERTQKHLILTRKGLNCLNSVLNFLLR